MVAIGASDSTAHTLKSDVVGVTSPGLSIPVDSASKITDAALDAAYGKFVITEIMSGIDKSLTAADQPRAQWIEVYNTGGVIALTSDDVVLLFTQNERVVRKKVVVQTVSDTTTYLNAVPATKPAGATYGNTYAVVDRVSTVNRFNGFWESKSVSGNTEALDDGTAPSTLASMYRKRSLKADGSVYLLKDGKPDGDKFLDGTDGAQWITSAARKNITGFYVGSPGSVHIPRIGGGVDFAKAAVVAVDNSGTGIIINEFRNDTSEANVDWIELHNNSALTTDPLSVSGYRLRLTTATLNADTGLYVDPTDTTVLAILPDYRIPAGGYLLITNRDPEDTVLAGGVNLNDALAAGGSVDVNRGAASVVYVSDGSDDDDVDGLNLPDGDFLITLRSGDKTNNHEQFVDFAGAGYFPDPDIGTDVYPLRGWAMPGDFKASEFVSSSSKAAARNNNGANRVHHEHWESVGAKGGIGYDSGVDLAAAPGTPGYANTALSNLYFDDKGNSLATDDYAFSGTVTISEVMYDAGPRWNLIQWIELYNSSMTEVVNLNGWELEIRNKEDVQSYVDSSFAFGEATILPNQTLLLVSGAAANDVASNRVYNLYQNHRRELGLLARDSTLLSRSGFRIRLTAKSKGDRDGRENVDVIMDTAGNVMIDDEEPAVRTIVWELYELSGPGEARSSIIRQYGTRDIDGSPDAASDGMMGSSWNESDLGGAGISYYGHRDDIGTPGYRLGGPLPVSLSSFRPVRDKTTGEIVIKWVTESELNNAGFNILRSESKDGEFQLVNLKGIIAGNGTTSERHVYEWTDTTAKPNVVYYYQIEDVSLNGNRTTLDTTHLRGNVTVAGKATTTWADLKSQR